MFTISTDTQNALLAALVAKFPSFYLKIYGGTVPALAKSSLGTATLLRTVSVDGGGTGLTFEATPVNGVLVKSTSEVWAGTNAASGVATFYRIVLPTDTGVESDTEARMQGSVGLVGADLILASTNLVIGEDLDRTIDYFVVGMPSA